MPNQSQFNSHQEYLKYYRNYRVKNKDKIKEINKRYRVKNDYGRKWRAKSKLATSAHDILNRALRNGDIKRMPCEICNTKKDIHAHHDNYYEPLKVRWLCRIHHIKEHKK